MKDTPRASVAGTVAIGGDLVVNRMGLGANRISDTPQASELLLRAVELGVNFIDTADIYGKHASEQMIANTLSPYPKGLIIATKGGMSFEDGKGIGRPEYLRQALEGSLKRLKIETVDLYQLHRIDANVSLDITMNFLKEMRDAGKIRHIGLSEATVEQISQARSIVPIATVQNQYNIVERKYESVLDYCEKEGIVFIPWYPLGHGRFPISEALTEIAEKYASTWQQIAVKWLLMRSPAMLPIPGTLSIQHLEANLLAATIPLTAEEFMVLSA